jgi:hypothetical protein
MSPILGTLASQFSGKSFGSFESIQTATVGAGGISTIEFTSIPSTYTHLQIRGIGRGTVSECDVKIQLNSDTGSNYAYHRVNGGGSSTGASDGSGSQTTMFYCGRLPVASSVFSENIVDILDYKDTSKNKSIRALMGWDGNGSGYVSLASGVWINTAAVNAIKLIPHSGNFAQHSHFALYGIKGE